MELNTPPLKEPFMGLRGNIAQVWATWFNQVYKIMMAVNPSISTDNGDAAVTLTAGKHAMVQIFSSPLTADRAVTLSTTGAYSGARFHITRESSATGVSNLNVGTGPLKALAAGQFCEVTFSGTEWKLTAFGSL